jgi:adenosylcobinamide-phosphate synthase
VVAGLTAAIRPDPIVLTIAVVLDLAIGDPTYRCHPVRVIGRSLTRIERWLRHAGADGYGGGILLLVLLSLGTIGPIAVVIVLAANVSRSTQVLCEVFLVYSLLALGDLLRHVWRVEACIRGGDVCAARTAVSDLVGRDTDGLDAGGCRRAVTESLFENLTDGFLSPLFWYVIGGLVGLVLFKIVSTMDSMVGYKTPAYLKFGWCGARLDDAMNYLPARFSWVLIGFVACWLPHLSGTKAWRIGFAQHGWLPSPNSGWSEATAAGALQRRLVGPIRFRGVEVTDLWLGDPADSPLAEAVDVERAVLLATATAVAFFALTLWLIVKTPISVNWS